ncbi:MAG TPA: hypothetical protein VJV74_05670 [Terriglobia bacterium]|nr:hypothetical protein [Terriglobia bacterium]
MTLRLTGKNGKLTIENLRHYPSDVVEKLRGLLVAGVNARPDPRRKGFYDVEDGARVFFIHISPVSGNVMLLATWCEEAPAAAAAPLGMARAFMSQFAA